MVLLISINDGLFLRKPNLNCLVRRVLWPMIIFLVVDEIINEKHMSHVDEAVRLICLVCLLICLTIICLVCWQSQVVPVILMILFEILFYFSIAISAWDILNHNISSSFFSSKNLFKIDWSTIIVTCTWNKTMSWLQIMVSHICEVYLITLFLCVIITIATNCT